MRLRFAELGLLPLWELRRLGNPRDPFYGVANPTGPWPLWRGHPQGGMGHPGYTGHHRVTIVALNPLGVAV